MRDDAGGLSLMCMGAPEQSQISRYHDFFCDQKSLAEAILPSKGWGIFLPSVTACSIKS